MATAVRLALGTASALGLARSAQGPIVPAMQDDLYWTSGDAGAMSAANGLGSAASAVLISAPVRRRGAAAAFRRGLVAVAVTSAGTAAGGEFVVLPAVRALAGAAGATVFIAGSVIAARMAAPVSSSAPVAVHFAGAGAGAGIFLSRATIPAPGDRRRASWAGLGVAATVAALISWSETGHDEEEPTGEGGRAQVRPLRRVAPGHPLLRGRPHRLPAGVPGRSKRVGPPGDRDLDRTASRDDGDPVPVEPSDGAPARHTGPRGRLGRARRWSGFALALDAGRGCDHLGGVRGDIHGGPGCCHRSHPGRGEARRPDSGPGRVHHRVRCGTERGRLAGALAAHTTTAAPLARTALPSAGAATLVAVPAKHESRTTAPLGTVADESPRL